MMIEEVKEEVCCCVVAMMMSDVVVIVVYYIYYIYYFIYYIYCHDVFLFFVSSDASIFILVVIFVGLPSGRSLNKMRRS